MRNKIGLLITSSTIIASLLIAGVASAQTTSGQGTWSGRARGVFGTVSAISGDTLTVTSKGFGKTPTPATYTVDATNATVTKNNVASSLSSVAVGDIVMIAGTVSGTNITATSIRDGMMMHMGMKPGSHMGSSTPATYSANHPSGAPASNNAAAASVSSGGFMGTIGGFFKHLFGFF